MPRRNNFTPPQRLTAPTRTAQRLQIRGFLQAGCSVRETAQNVGCAPSTVQIWKKRFKNAETEEDKPHTGRPVTITPARRNALRTQNMRGQSTRKLAANALADMKSFFPASHKNAWIFQHDGASAHKDRLTNEWLRQHVPKFITSGPTGKWPPTSPDLNWIEDLWGILGEKLKSYSIPVKNVDQLKRRLRKCWADIPVETLQKCATSMPDRLQQVIDGNGDALRR